MMVRAFDKFTYYCPHCGHKWILESDVYIIPKVLDEWLADVKEEHRKICQEGE